MSTDEDFIAEARAAADAERAELHRTLAADRRRRSRGITHPGRWLLQGVFEWAVFALITCLVIAIMAAIALSQTIGITFQAAAVIVGLGAVVLMGLWASLR